MCAQAHELGEIGILEVCNSFAAFRGLKKKEAGNTWEIFFFTEKFIVDDIDQKLDFSLESKNFLKLRDIASPIREN